MLVLAVLGLVTYAESGRASAASVWPGLGLFALPAASRFALYRRHGPLGQPTVSLHEGQLVLSLPQDSRRQATLATAEFSQVIVYGRVGRRTFRFVRQDGTWREVTPAWGAKVECAAVAFLQHHLPPAMRVTVEEPQTLFAAIRGDGP